MTDSRDDYIGIGFHAGTDIGILEEELHLAIEPDDVDVTVHEESAADVVSMFLTDDDRSAQVHLVIDVPRWRELVAEVEEADDG